LTQTYLESDYIIIDYKFLNKPKKILEEIADFWGGYKVEFKIVDKKTYDDNNGNIDKVRKGSIPVHPGSSPVFELEFSKFEHIGHKKAIVVDGYKIYVYTPEMIVFEKLRAICQQIPEYKKVVVSFTSRARARDFYDIYLTMEMHKIDPTTKENKGLIKNIFEAKKVPINFIKEIRNNKAMHTDNWQSVKDTISAYEKLEGFDYYFNFVARTFENITFL
jgi:hypothetical protein